MRAVMNEAAARRDALAEDMTDAALIEKLPFVLKEVELDLMLSLLCGCDDRTIKKYVRAMSRFGVVHWNTHAKSYTIDNEAGNALIAKAAELKAAELEV